MMRHLRFLAAAIILPYLSSSPATAAGVMPPGLDVDISIDGINNGNYFHAMVDPGNLDQFSFMAPSPNGDGSFTMSGTMGMNSVWDFAWAMTFQFDPFISAVLTVTNSNTVTQTFTAILTLPVSPTWASPSLIDGNITVDVKDNGADGATAATTGGSPLYAGLIDGSPIVSLMGDPTSVFAPPGGTGSLSTAFGPTAIGTGVSSTLGIKNVFALSAGDTVTLTEFFQAVPVAAPVPEPTAIALVGGAFIGLVGLRRRKTA